MTARLLVIWCLLLALWANRAYGGAPDPRDLVRARALDHEGARAFRDGRYNDAIRYFEDAHRLGAPSLELWNIAKCELTLDEPEKASESLEAFLASPDLTPGDRAEAKRQLEELRERRSTVTIASSPTGARVAVDGRRVGTTPLSVEVSAGGHTIAVEREGHPPHVEHVDARFGRAVIIDAHFGDDELEEEPAGHAPHAKSHPVRRFTAGAELGLIWARLGSFVAPAHPAALVDIGYVLHDAHRLVFSLGVHATLTYDTWGDGVMAASPTGCIISTDESAAALSAFLEASLGYRWTRRLRVSGDVGIGGAAIFASQLGGDVFVPTCSPQTSLKPAVRVAAALSYAFTPALRGILSPILFEVQPAFVGTRTAPIDTAGPWIRFGGALGFAVDL